MKTLIGSLMLVGTIATVGFEAYSLDGITGLVAPLGFPEDTRYAVGYSTAAFKRIRRGDSEQRVRQLLGAPLIVGDFYDSGPCDIVWIVGDSVHAVSPDGCAGTRDNSIVSIRGALGFPREERWFYSNSPSGQSYRQRIVDIRDGRVSGVKSEYYVD